MDRLRVASGILRGKTTDSQRIVTESINVNTGAIGIFGGLQETTEGKDFFEQVSIKDLESEPLHTLLHKVIKSDPAIDQIASFFTTLTTQQHKVTSESSRGDRAIQEILDMLEAKKNPLSLAVSHCASSLIVRGDICIETEFNESNRPENLWVPDPRWVDWRLVSESGTQRWGLWTYGTGKWEEITSPNVHYIAGEPLIGERSSRSPLQTSLFPAISESSMINTLQSILDIHAWAQTVFSVKKLEMIKLENDGAHIEDINAQVLEAMELIKALGKKRPDQVMGVTDDIEPMHLPGGGEEYTFTKTIGELYDKRIAMGSKTPTTVGGPSERADYSTKENGLFYSAYLLGAQENIKDAIEWAFRRFFRSMGVSADPIYTSKSTNVQARMIEADAFAATMKGIAEAVKSGMPLPLAIEFFEEESGRTFSADLKARIEKEVMAPAPSPMGDPDGEAEEPEMQDNQYLAAALVQYFRKRR